MHVLEHVGNPRMLVEKLRALTAPAGHLYLEIPIELANDAADRFERRTLEPTIVIHEHVNIFGADSIPALAQSLGLPLLAFAVDDIALGRASLRVGRYLLQNADADRKHVPVARP